MAQSCSQFNSITGRAELEYHLTPSIMVFGGYDRGNKGQAFDLTSSLTTRSLVASGPGKGFPTADAIASNQPVSPETVNAYQAGWKSELFDNQLVWNVTAFDEIFHHFQAQTRDPNTLQNELNSLGSVTTKGVETELTAAPYQGLTVNVAGAYDEAVINTFNNAACFPSQRRHWVASAASRTSTMRGSTMRRGGRRTSMPNTTTQWKTTTHCSPPPRGTGSRAKSSTSCRIRTLCRNPMVSLTSVWASRRASGSSRCSATTCSIRAMRSTGPAMRPGTSIRTAHPLVPSPDAIEYAPGRDSIRYFGIQLGFTY